MSLAALEQLPPSVVAVLDAHVQILRDALGEKLVGVYVHGSIALGGFHPERSDLDYLAVVEGPLTRQERATLATAFLAGFGQDVPVGGVEMSIVEAHYAGPGYRYPTPYAFHMGTREQVRMHGLPPDRETLDPDLAAHFTITKRRGLCVYGRPIDEVFTEVPRADYLDSIVLDAEECYHNIQTKSGPGPCAVPKYAVLNFCRVLAVIEADLVTSKVEGGEWGLAHLPSRYHPVIAAALEEVREGASAPVDGELLKEYATYAWARIRA